MKSSVFIATCGAVLAAAGPILQGRRLFVKTDTVIEWVTVTVTEGDKPSVFVRPNSRPKPTTTSVAPPPPATTEAPPPPPPAPSTTAPPVVEPAPEPTPTPSPEPAPAAESPAPVVQAAQPSPSPEPAPAPAPATTAQAAAAAPSDYISTALYHHNVHRSNHSAGALEWSDEHAGYAQTLADRCNMAHDTTIGGGGYGQNLAMWGSSSNPEAFGATGSVARAASNGWYNSELLDFPSGDYGKGSPDMSNFEKWGHYSQLVWVGSQKVGCASKFCPAGTLSSMGSWYTVCNYYPAGNMGGDYANNVKPPQGQSVVTAA